MAVLTLAACWLADQWSEPFDKPPTGGVYRVRRVVDGDTLLLAGGQRVRLQGVNTPETVRPGHPVELWGPEASAFARHYVEAAGWRVRLAFGAERVDRYGRWVAFVWSGERMLNEELVRAGLAEARLDYRFAGKMKSRLRAAEDEARLAARGMWSGAPPVLPPVPPPLPTAPFP